MSETLVCWRCGHSLAAFSLPLERLAACPSCHADLHACRLCQFFNPKMNDRCDEPLADAVGEPERANFCDYFKPRPGAYEPQDKNSADQDKILEELHALFGKTPEPKNDSSGGDLESEMEALFRKKK